MTQSWKCCLNCYYSWYLYVFWFISIKQQSYHPRKSVLVLRPFLSLKDLRARTLNTSKCKSDSIFWPIRVQSVFYSVSRLNRTLCSMLFDYKLTLFSSHYWTDIFHPRCILSTSLCLILISRMTSSDHRGFRVFLLLLLPGDGNHHHLASFICSITSIREILLLRTTLMLFIMHQNECCLIRR